MGFKSTAVLAMVFVAGAAQAMYKCPGPGGRPAFQDAPCANGGGQVLDVKPIPESGASGQADAQARIAKMRADNEMSAAIREKRPLPGMTVRQLADAMGRPDTVNTDSSAAGVREQAIYYRDNGTWYVYVMGGVVDTVQHRPLAPHMMRRQGPPVSAWKARHGRCPLSNELREAEMAAESITNTPDERKARMEILHEMRACK